MIQSSTIISEDLVEFSRRSFRDLESALPIYLHIPGGAVEIGGGAYGPQIIETLPFSEDLQSWFKRQVNWLDSIITLDFIFKDNSNGTRIDFYLDTVIQLGSTGSTLGLAVPNTVESKDDFNDSWWEIILNAPEFNSEEHLRYAILHEFGHSLGLEHPFDNQDGDSNGIIFGDPDGSATVMSYTKPSAGWPTAFSGHDLAALALIWGLEPNTADHWIIQTPNGLNTRMSTSNATRELMADIPGVQLIGPDLIDLITSDPADQVGSLRRQAGDSIFYALSQGIQGESTIADAIRRGIAQIDSAIELDFIEIIDEDIELAQLYFEIGDLSGIDSGGNHTLGRNESIFSLIELKDQTYRFNAINRITIDLDSFSMVSDDFADLSVFVEHVTLHELGHALSLRHPWESNDIDPSLFTTSQTVMAYTHDAPLTSPTLTNIDIQALTDLHGEETGNRYQTNDYSVPEIVFGFVEALVDEETSLTTLRVPIKRVGRQDLYSSVLLELKSFTLLESESDFSMLNIPEPIEIGPGQTNESIELLLPTGLYKDIHLGSLWATPA